MVKIFTNTFIAKKSLTMAYTVLNFDYLQYFFEVEVMEYNEIVKSKRQSLAEN